MKNQSRPLVALTSASMGCTAASSATALFFLGHPLEAVFVGVSVVGCLFCVWLDADVQWFRGVSHERNDCP